MERFFDWEDLVSHVRAGWPVYYQAPLDVRAVLVRAKVVRDGEAIRVAPPQGDPFDPFDANRDHVSRFHFSFNPDPDTRKNDDREADA